jgi:ADP-ribosyl-[dinitrogen reductase] hydrolase
MDPVLSRFEGCLLGGMAGDALGLPREGLSPGRAARLFGPELSHRLLFRRGMASDDTEHACMTAQALLSDPADPARFARVLARKLRWWVLGVPAGIGFATLRSILKLWLGVPPSRSGVRSAGNGPAMRSPVIGLFFHDHPEQLRLFVRASTAITHRDPRAERGALAAALAARYAIGHGPGDFRAADALDEIATAFPGEDVEARAWLEAVRRAVGERWDPDRFARELGMERGVSGYVYRTVPAVLYSWLLDTFDFRRALTRVIAMGGDADTTGAILGGIAGAACGVERIPEEWVSGILEFPRTARWVRVLAGRLHRRAVLGEDAGPQPLAWPLLVPRNILFALVVLAHGFRRLLPT